MKKDKTPFDLTIEELAEAGRAAAAEAVSLAKRHGVAVAGKQVESIGSAKPSGIRRLGAASRVKAG